MPVHVKKVAGKFRVVDDSTNRITREPTGTAVDGGGHRYEQKAYRQTEAINRALKRKKKKK